MYINKETKQYNITEQDIRALYPNTSFTAPFVAPEPFAYVFPAPAPAYDSMTQIAREIDPVLTDKGHYEKQWEVIDLDPTVVAERKAAALQTKRETLVCTPWQIRKAMTALGIRDAVEAAVAVATQDVKDAYNYAQDFKRLDPFVTDIGAAVSKTDEELDALFELAMTL